MWASSSAYSGCFCSDGMAVPAAKLGRVGLVHANLVSLAFSVDQRCERLVQLSMIFDIKLKDHRRKVIRSHNRIRGIGYDASPAFVFIFIPPYERRQETHCGYYRCCLAAPCQMFASNDDRGHISRREPRSRRRRQPSTLELRTGHSSQPSDASVRKFTLLAAAFPGW